MTSADVVVIGGGVIGTSVAYHLARRSLQVALIERQEIAVGASGACDGFVWLRSKPPGPVLDLARQSADRYQTLDAELDADLHHRRRGGLVLVETQAQRAALSAEDAEWISGDDLRRRLPFLSPRLLGASHCPTDATVDPLLTTWAFAHAARRLGAHIFTGEPVTGIAVRAGRIHAVETPQRRIACRFAVNCAGSWAGEVARLARVALPVTPRRGQLLVSEPLSTDTEPAMLCGCYLDHKSRPVSPGDTEPLVSFSLEQTAEGNLVIGSTREFVGFDRSVTLQGIAAITAHARRVAPGLADVNIIRAFAGLRPYTPDGLPFIGETEVRGFYAACGHEGDGIALAPSTGDLLAALLTGDTPPLAPAFSPARL